jgi:hypothetical protein
VSAVEVELLFAAALAHASPCPRGDLQAPPHTIRDVDWCNVVYPEPVGALKDGLVERRGASGTARTQLVGVVFLGDLAVVGLSTRSWGVAAGPGSGSLHLYGLGPDAAPALRSSATTSDFITIDAADSKMIVVTTPDSLPLHEVWEVVDGALVRRPDPTDAAAQSPLIHQYKGYDVRVEAWTFSQGDAGFDPQPVTGPVPPDVGAALTLAAAANEAELIATAEHFLRGKHPYQASRGLVRTVPGALPSAPSFELQTSSMNVRRDDGMTVSSRPQLTVNLTATTAAEQLLHKVIADAALSQLFRTSKPTGGDFDVLKRRFEDPPGRGQGFDLELVNAVRAHPKTVAAWAAEPLGAVPPPADQYTPEGRERIAASHRRLRARLFTAVLAQTPYPDDLWDHVAALPGSARAKWMEELILALSDRTSGQLASGPLHDLLWAADRPQEVEYLRGTLVYALERHLGWR